MNHIEVLKKYHERKTYQEIFAFLASLTDYYYAVVKGEILSFMAYGEFGMRNSSDVDILVSKETLPKVEKILEENGYATISHSRADHVIMLTFSHQVSPWSKPMPPFGYVTIDLNFDIFWGEYEGKIIDIDEFLSDTIGMNIHGVNVKTLPPIKALIQLILHHYKDMNSLFLLATRKSIKYDMFKDVYYLLKNNLDTIPLDKLCAMSAEYEIIPYVFYVLYYTGQVFDDNDLRQYIEAFRTPKGEALLNCYGLCAKERKEWKCDFKTRLDSENLYELIKNDLTDKDREKISINKRIFMGVYE